MALSDGGSMNSASLSPPIDQEAAQKIYCEIERILATAEKHLSGAKLRQLYQDILIYATEQQQLFFPNVKSRLIYILNVYPLPLHLTREIEILYQYFHKRKRQHLRQIAPLSILKALALLVEALSPIPIPPSLHNHFQGVPSITDQLPAIGTIIHTIEGTLREVSSENDQTQLHLSNPFYGTVVVTLHPLWVQGARYLWKNAFIRFYHLLHTAEDNHFLMNEHSIMIVEPDYLVDITELTEAIVGRSLQFSPHRLLTTWLNRDFELSEKLLIGVLVNECLDLRLTHPELLPQEAFQIALQRIQHRYCHYPNARDILGSPEILQQKVLPHLSTIDDILAQFSNALITVEPWFIAPEYGLSGRLDLFLEYPENTQRKDVIELKSGSFPSDSSLGNGVYPEHALQAGAYHLLLNAAYKKRKGSSAILYSKASPYDYPLRNVENSPEMERKILALRNMLVIFHSLFAQGKGNIGAYFSSLPNTLPRYLEEPFHKLSTQWQTLSVEERAYCIELFRFLFRERWSATKTYTADRIPKLWESTLDDKRQEYTCLADLKLQDIDTSLSPFTLRFDIPTHQREIPFQLHTGDRVILYPQILEDEQLQFRQLLRGTITERSTNSITIALLNHINSPEWFRQWQSWIIESDINISLFRRLTTSLALFLFADHQQRKKVLGLTPPAQEERQTLRGHYPYLTEHQKSIVQKCLNSPDYFLLQGPPGTGKTSYFIRSVVEEFVRYQNKRLLLLAYTNRAVDELCQSLTQAGIAFYRLGSETTTAFPEATVAHVARNNDILSIIHSLQTVPCVLSTVSTLLQYPEILTQSFDVLIVDEASQLLELHLAGILAAVPRFILVGDEKQLPAVVQQRHRKLPSKHPLRQFGFISIGTSVFERMKHQIQQKQWHWCIGSLKEQGRFHIQIQNLANHLFYAGELQPLTKSQQQLGLPSFLRLPSNHPFTALLQESRILFFNTRTENQSKINHSEAQLIAKIVKFLFRFSPELRSGERTIGIITPFRAQIALLRKILDPSIVQNITIDTVECYQGSERDIIAISLCANTLQHLRLSQNLDHSRSYDRKFNVAITRAKEYLLLFGNVAVLNQDYLYAHYLHAISHIGKVILDPEMLCENIFEV